MQYSYPSKGFIIGAEELQMTGALLMYAMKQIRVSAGLPLTRMAERPDWNAAAHALATQMDIARNLGIDLGAREWFELDVSQAG